MADQPTLREKIEMALAPALAHADNIGTASYADLKVVLGGVRQALAEIASHLEPVAESTAESAEAEEKKLFS